MLLDDRSVSDASFPRCSDIFERRIGNRRRWIIVVIVALIIVIMVGILLDVLVSLCMVSKRVRCIEDFV